MNYSRLILLFLVSLSCFLDLVNAKNIALVVRPFWYGELELASKVQIACNHIGWTAEIIDFQDPSIEEKKFDFIITLVPDAYKPSICRNYLALFHPKHHYYDSQGFLLYPYNNYDGYLITYTLGKNEKDFADADKFPWFYWLPTTQFTEYKEVNPTNLFYLCCSWGNRSNDIKYVRLTEMLSRKSYSRFYGAQRFKSLYPNSYVSSLPFDGVSVLESISDSGICLIFHSDDHLKEGLPSGRIFEAAAASAVVICDRNEFVKKHFGDSVLYVDESKNSKSMFNQIDRHMQWIKSHREEALEKAEKMHAIFESKFLLESQLLKLGEFHDRLISEN